MAYEECAKYSSGPPSTRFTASRWWSGSYRLLHGQPLLEAHENTLSLLPQIVWLGTNITRRYEEIASIGNTVNTAVAAAISVNRYDLAVEWLEQGRSIVWSQILHMRTPLEDLQGASPALSRRLTAILRQLETAGTSQMEMDAEMSQTEKVSLDEQARQHRRLAGEYENTLVEVRKIPGFENFLKPKQFSELRLAARDGLVTMINVSDERCDALVLRDDDMRVLHIPLPELTLDVARTMQEKLVETLKERMVRSRDSNNRASTRVHAPGKEPMQQLLEWLWRTVVCPIMVRVHEEVGFLSNHVRSWYSCVRN